MNGAPAKVLLVGFPVPPAGLDCFAAGDEAEALALLAQHPVAVLCLGENLSGSGALRFLERALSVPGLEEPNLVVTAGGENLDLFSDLAQRDDLFYLSRQPPADEDLVRLLRCAAESWRSRRAPRVDLDERRRQFLREAAGRLELQQTLAGAGELAGLILRELVEAERSFCLLFDAAEDLLWSGITDERRRESPAIGLVSFVVRTGQAVVLDSVAGDPRWDRATDDPEGSGKERFLAVPVRGAEAQVAAVLGAVRGPDRPPFDAQDLAAAARLATYAGPVLGRLRVQALIDGEEAALADLWRGEASPFRPEALEEHAAGLLGRGEVIRLSSGWVPWAFRLVVGLAVAGLLALILGSWR